MLRRAVLLGCAVLAIGCAARTEALITLRNDPNNCRTPALANHLVLEVYEVSSPAIRRCDSCPGPSCALHSRTCFCGARRAADVDYLRSVAEGHSVIADPAVTYCVRMLATLEPDDGPGDAVACDCAPYVVNETPLRDRVRLCATTDDFTGDVGGEAVALCEGDAPVASVTWALCTAGL